MKVKVCGMTEENNARGLLALRPDYFGLIFVPTSPRVYRTPFSSELRKDFRTAGVRACGVFMDADWKLVADTIDQHELDAVQLHGKETPEYCAKLRTKFPKVEILKTVSVSSATGWNLKDYFDCTDLFLFDTASEKGGGTGQKFDWGLLENYRGPKGYFLSGGIEPADSSRLCELGAKEASLKGVDINSRFESQPGVKSLPLVQRFISEVRHDV
jgi:phosphoribosylanthranilate isomerase